MRAYFQGLVERFFLTVFIWSGSKMYTVIRVHLEPPQPGVPDEDREVTAVTFARSSNDLKEILGA